ncbi:FAD/NAD(P)-binding domain-containing protein [Ascodesmis nigricans]|uniref:Kynurenine 3-monooxygenase n=1 Tax=Ascodesmis nigricans TaxID=341454 RepID=A0A4V3SIN7_9PEZI|nr:FAD/NAD(P)-binding domain-containing protein [Ascodesmis nigricans]
MAAGASSTPATGAPAKKVLVVGAGPVGALVGLYFSYDGWDVEIYERRGDLRDAAERAAGIGKSINLALSERGITGLRNIGDGGALLDKVLEQTIPMPARMIHSGKVGEEGDAQPYDGVFGRYIRSADRAELSCQMLDALDERENVKLCFGERLVRMKLDTEDGPEAIFIKKGSGEEHKVKADLIVGADGAFSTVRYQMQRYVKQYYEQTYIPTLWCEFTIPPTASGDFAIPPNYLHIWPKQTYMFIAIPSMDKSFTCTLFMPELMFATLTTPSDVITFFRENFADVVELLGEESLVEQYFMNQHLPLVSIRTTPYHYKDRCVIVGDSAHAMVPFYGQGMNAGFESVRILHEHLAANPGDIRAALQQYSEFRVRDAWAIVELAMQNYDEMRSGVTKRGYRLRKWVQESLMRWAPWLGVETLYSMVSFGNGRYSEVLRKAKMQGIVEERVMIGIVAWVVGLLGWRVGVARAAVTGAKTFWRTLRW